MDIQILKTFLELDRTRHFGKTAAALFVTQSAVSARIRLLEETLGAELFIRRRNEIRLTGAGERLKRHAETIVAAWQRALAEAAMNEGHKLSLVIGGIHSLWDCLLQPWVHNLYKHRPDISLQVEAHGVEFLNKKIADGGLDVAFLFEPPHPEQWLVREVATLRLVLVSSRAVLDMHAALKVGYVVVDWGPSFAAVHARHFPESPQPVMRMSDARAALAFLMGCGGSAYLPEAMVAEHVQSGRLFKLGAAPAIERRIYAVYQGYGERRKFIEEALGFLGDDTVPQWVQSSSLG